MSGRLPQLAAAAFVVGLLLILLIEAPVARIVGVPLTFVGIALGVAAIATPEFLAGDRDEARDGGEG
ncbi:MAG TPA: hypothetical protein VIL04_07500 [Solirubrobacterales bacterium]|jgi:hypothetical protein